MSKLDIFFCLIFRCRPVCHHMQQYPFSIHQRVFRSTRDIFPYFPRHLTFLWSFQHPSSFISEMYLKPVASLPDQKFSLSHFFNGCAQIRCKAVFSVPAAKNTHSPCKMHSCQGDGCGCKHKRSFRQEILGVYLNAFLTFQNQFQE